MYGTYNHSINRNYLRNGNTYGWRKSIGRGYFGSGQYRESHSGNNSAVNAQSPLDFVPNRSLDVVGGRNNPYGNAAGSAGLVGRF